MFLFFSRARAEDCVFWSKASLGTLGNSSQLNLLSFHRILKLWVVVLVFAGFMSDFHCFCFILKKIDTKYQDFRNPLIVLVG